MDDTKEEGRLVREKEIPIWVGDGEREWLPVTIDGHRAEIIISYPAWRSEKVCIKFDPPHPEYGEGWGTKYFTFLAPGRLGWGYEKVVWEVLHRDVE